ncbi:MAG: hypothetical protein ACR2JC_01780 [Chloroflexota bacterium]
MSDSQILSIIAIVLVALAASVVDSAVKWSGFGFFRWGPAKREIRRQNRQDQSVEPPPDDVEGGDHPAGFIRLGRKYPGSRAFDLPLSALAQHVFLPGASGTGKTTTLARIAQGALRDGWGIVIVDAKGGTLKRTAGDLATQGGVALQIVDPADPGSLGYNPATGVGNEVANKLVGAFTFSPTAEIYQNIAMTILPPVVDALRLAGPIDGIREPGEDVTVSVINKALGMLGVLARANIPENMQEQLTALLTARTGIGDEGISGLQWRLGALLQGHFASLLNARTFLDWDSTLRHPGVTYFSLPSLGAAKDVELFGRVIAMDLQAAANRRLEDLRNGVAITPILVVLDEFTRLGEAAQITGLQLLAREARMSVLVSTQVAPQDPMLRAACMSSGLLIVHRPDPEMDTEALAGVLGTRRTVDTTYQKEFTTGFSEKGSIRQVREYWIHPDQLRNFAPGVTAVKVAGAQEPDIVRVSRP